VRSEEPAPPTQAWVVGAVPRDGAVVAAPDRPVTVPSPRPSETYHAVILSERSERRIWEGALVREDRRGLGLGWVILRAPGPQGLMASAGLAGMVVVRTEPRPAAAIVPLRINCRRVSLLLFLLSIAYFLSW